MPQWPVGLTGQYAPSPWLSPPLEKFLPWLSLLVTQKKKTHVQTESSSLRAHLGPPFISVDSFTLSVPMIWHQNLMHRWLNFKEI